MKSTDNEREKPFNEKATAYMNLVKGKSLVYWETARIKTTDLWNRGTKGKLTCIGAVIGVLLLGYLIFGGESKTNKKSVATTGENDKTLHTQANTHHQPEPHKDSGDEGIVTSENTKLQPVNQEDLHGKSEVERIGAQALAEIEAATGDAKEFFNIADGYLSAGAVWGQTLHYAPEKKVSYDEFAKGYYLIDDALAPKFATLLATVRFPLGVSQSIMKDLMPRAEHLLYYCSRTGLSDKASQKERLHYLQMIYLARWLQLTMASYAWAYGQDSRQKLAEAGEMLTQYVKVKKLLPPHSIAKDAEERYAALPYPARPLDLQQASSKVDDNAQDFEKLYHKFWPEEKENDSKEEKAEHAKKKAALAERKWIPIDIVNFPIKTFCGLEFGQTLATCEKILGECIGPSYDAIYGPYHGYMGLAVYNLKKPFRMFTRACLRFTSEKKTVTTADGFKDREQFFQALRSIQLEADISGEINYESCLEELSKVKKLLEEKFKLNLGEGQAGDDQHGKSYWYGVGLSETGWIVLGIRTATDGWDLRDDGRKTMVLEVRYANPEKMQEIVNDARKEFDTKHAKEAESKKEKLNLSDNVGADVL